MGMLIIGVPFAVSMRLSSNRSRTALAGAHARFAAEGAYNHAIACLMRTQEQNDAWPRVRVREADTTLFEPHTLDIPAELEVVFEPDYDVEDDPDRFDNDPDRDLYISPDELPTRDSRGAIWSVEVEDEQGKINLNSASKHLLENLLYLLRPDIEGDAGDTEDEIKAKWKAAADEAAGDLIDYRRENGGFSTVSEAETVLRDTGHFDSGQLTNFSSYVTVSSERPNPSAPHPININTAPQLVLVANLMGLRLATLQAVRGAGNVGNGSPSPIRVAHNTPEGDWKLQLTDDPDDADDYADGADLFYRNAAEPTWAVVSGGLPLNESITHGGLQFSVYSGTVPFAGGDEFYFSTRCITEDLARDMAEAMQREVTLRAGVTESLGDGIEAQTFYPQGGPLLGNAADQGHLAVGRDVMLYTFYPGGQPWEPDYYRVVNHDREYDQGQRYKARQIIPGHRDLDILWSVIYDHFGRNTDNFFVVDSLLSAIKLNAFRPLSADLDGPTAPFCFTTSDVYTIAGRASVSDKAGNELAARGVRKIISLKRPIRLEDGGTTMEGVWTVDTQSAFDALITGTSQSGFRCVRKHHDVSILSMPFNFRPQEPGYINLPRLYLPSRKLSDVAVHPSISLHFGGDVAAASNAIDRGIAPLALLPYGMGDDDVQNTNATTTNEEGLLFKKGWDMLPYEFATWPRLAYSTQHAPIPRLGSTCKSIEMWFKPEQTAQEKENDLPPWSDDERDYFLFDTSLPYCGLGESYGSEALAKLCHQNRIAIFYSGSTQELVFRISDATMSEMSADVRYHFVPEDQPGWHHLKAIWSGMEFGEMVLLIDGEAPDGEDPDDGGTGRYHPKLKWSEWRGLSSANLPIIVGNQIYENPDDEGPSRGTPGDLSLRHPDDPVQPYGYKVSFSKINTGSDADDTDDFNDLSTYGRSAVAGGDLSAQPQTQVMPPDGVTPVPADATEIPVESTDAFQESGFLRIGNEIIYYAGKAQTSFTDVMRGVNIAPGGFSPDQDVGSTGVATEPADITPGTNVVQISICVDDNRHYPTPLYFYTDDDDIVQAAGYFGISDKPKNYVRIGDEFISYTHKPGTNYLVDVKANTVDEMRGQLGSTPSDHAAGAAVYPVYRFSHGTPGGPAEGDEESVVTIIDDDLEPFEMVIHTIEGNNIAFTDYFPLNSHCRLTRTEDGESVANHPRFLKFPSGELNAGKFFSIGTNSGPKAEYDDDATNPFKMDMPAEATIDEFKVSLGEEGIPVARVTGDPVPSSGLAQIFILQPNRWDEDFDLSSGGSAVGSWPTQGYAQIGDEIIYYRTLYRHNVQEKETGAGAVCAPSSVSIGGVINKYAGSIRWSWPADYQEGDDPGTAGFCEDGGYLTIVSRTPYSWQAPQTVQLTEAAVQHLLDAGLLTQEQLEGGVLQDGIWTFTTEGGLTGGGTVREVIKYDSLEQIGNEWEFTAVQRGLFGTTPSKHEPVQELDENGQPKVNDDGNPVWVYPRLIANIAELQIVQRACLGTQAKRHPLGSKIMPLYHIVSTFMTDPLPVTGNKLYVESNANFPHRGYLLVSDGTKQEIIGYTSKGYDEDVDPDDGETVKPYFAGVRYLRRRFGTPLVDLNFAEQSVDHLNKGVVRLYEPRYDDRLPVDPETGEFAWDTGDVNIEGNPAYLEITRTIRGARWESITWAEGPDATWDDPAPDRTDTGTEIFILARVDGKPDWTEEPVLRSDYDPDDGPAILKFDDPVDSDREPNRIDIDGDTLELRIYFKYNSYYADQATGRIKEWLSPLLRGLKIGYSAPSSVYRQEEVRF